MRARLPAWGRAAFVILSRGWGRRLLRPAAAAFPPARDAARSDFAAVVRPLEHGLPLPRPAGQVARLAVPLDLPDVPAHRLPSSDLPPVFIGHAAAHVIAAVPLEPTAGVVGVDPTLLAPHRQRLAGVDAEEVERAVAAARGQLGAGEPVFGKLLAGIGHVLAAEDAKPQHLLRRELGSELRVEIAADRRGPQVAVALLHLVVHDDGRSAHFGSLAIPPAPW